jgi:predicted naringenin-chalcone synthase
MSGENIKADKTYDRNTQEEKYFEKEATLLSCVENMLEKTLNRVLDERLETRKSYANRLDNIEDQLGFAVYKKGWKVRFSGPIFWTVGSCISIVTTIILLILKVI